MKKKKFLKALFSVMFVLAIIDFVLYRYIGREPLIRERISAYNPVSISLNDSLKVRAYSTSLFFKHIEDGEYKKAYGMLTDEYKKYVSYDDFLESLKVYDHTNLGVKSVKQLTDHTFVVLLEDKDTKEEHLYTVYSNRLNNEIFTISPDKFVYFDKVNSKKSNAGLEVTLESFLVLQDSINIKLKVKNKTSKEIDINDVRVELALSGRLANKFEKTTIAPKEERSIDVVYTETSYYLPKSISVETPKSSVYFELKEY